MPTPLCPLCEYSLCRLSSKFSSHGHVGTSLLMKIHKVHREHSSVCFPIFEHSAFVTESYSYISKVHRGWMSWNKVSITKTSVAHIMVGLCLTEVSAVCPGVTAHVVTDIIDSGSAMLRTSLNGDSVLWGFNTCDSPPVFVFLFFKWSLLSETQNVYKNLKKLSCLVFKLSRLQWHRWLKTRV